MRGWRLTRWTAWPTSTRRTGAVGWVDEVDVGVIGGWCGSLQMHCRLCELLCHAACVSCPALLLVWPALPCCPIQPALHRPKTSCCTPAHLPSLSLPPSPAHTGTRTGATAATASSWRSVIVSRQRARACRPNRPLQEEVEVGQRHRQLAVRHPAAASHCCRCRATARRSRGCSVAR